MRAETLRSEKFPWGGGGETVERDVDSHVGEGVFVAVEGCDFWEGEHLSLSGRLCGR